MACFSTIAELRILRPLKLETLYVHVVITTLSSSRCPLNVSRKNYGGMSWLIAKV